MADYWKISVNKYKDSTGNWKVLNMVESSNDPYLSITGKVDPMVKYKEPAAQSSVVQNQSMLDNDGKEFGSFKVSAELTGLINPFTNPVTNAQVKETKIEVSYEGDPWEYMVDKKTYSESLALGACEKIEKRYKDLFGVEIKLKRSFVSNPDESKSTSGNNGTSGEKGNVVVEEKKTTGTTGTSVQTEPQIYGEFTFNVEDAFLLKGNQDFDLLEILYKGLTKEEVEVIEEEIIDEEYEEEPYTAEEEVAIDLAEAREEERLRIAAEAALLKDTDQIGEDVPGSPVKQKDVKDAIITVMDILIKEGGFTKEQAAGICGNIKAESAFKYWNVEDGTANVRPGGMSSDRWDSKRAYGKHYSGGKSSGIGLAQWTYSRRYKMEKYVGEYLADKGISAKTLKDRFLDTDPGLHSGDLSTVYGGAGNSLETYLKTIDKLFEAQCSFLQHELKNSYSGIIKTFNGSSPSGNSKRLIKKGFFINQKEGKVAQTVAGYAECVVCDFEVPQPITGGDKDKYKNLVKERTKHATDCLATYNSK